MRFQPEPHHRRSIRLRGYDYTQTGAYFVTICTYQRECLLGEVVDGSMTPSQQGRIVELCWQRISQHFPTVEVDSFTLMPNHVHGVLWFSGRGKACRRVGAQHAAPLPPNQKALAIEPSSLATIVRSFKSAATKHVNEIRGTPGFPLWQRNYYEHIIRNEEELTRIRNYIVNNPLQWELDRENPAVTVRKKPAESWQV